MIFKQWRDISIADIAFYAIIIMMSIYPAIRIFAKGSYFKWFYIRYFLMIIAKLAGGCTSIVFIHDLNNRSQGYNVGLLIASLILNLIATGLTIVLYVCTTVYISRVMNNGLKREKPISAHKRVSIFAYVGVVLSNPRDLQAWEGVIEKIVGIAVIINAVGGGMSNGDLSTSKKLLEAGSILYLVTFLGAFICTFVKFLQVSKGGYYQSSLLLVLVFLLLTSPFIFIRIIYSILSAFNMKTNTTYVDSFSRYTFLLGDWKIYAFVAFMEECITILTFAIITWVVKGIEESPSLLSPSNRTPKTENSDEESQN